MLSKYSAAELQDNSRTRVLAGINLVVFLISFMLTCYTHSYMMATLTGYMMVILVGMGHNFVHQKENPWRYLFEFTGFSHREWEIYHAISHHSLMNTELDYEIGAFEPVVYFLRTMPSNPKYVELYLQLFFFLMIPINLIVKLILKVVRRKTINW